MDSEVLYDGRMTKLPFMQLLNDQRLGKVEETLGKDEVLSSSKT